MATTVLITDEQLRLIADPVETYTTLDVHLKHNQVSTGEFAAAASSKLMSAVTQPNARVLVIREGTYLIGGPIERPGAYKWERDGPGTVTVGWADHLALIGQKLVYPNPDLTEPAQTATHFDRTGNAETIMRDIVNLNCGLGAVAARRIPRLTVAPANGVGTITTVSSRFEPMLDVLRKVALTGGGLGFRVKHTSARDLAFEVFAPPNRSKQLVYSADRGNIYSLTTDPQSPKVTVALVGGSGEGISRPIIVVHDLAAEARWGRMEQWVSQDDSLDDPVLQQAGEVALLDGGETIGLSVTALDHDGQRYGVDYHLGDLVGVELGYGPPIVDIVSAVDFKISADGGEQITPTIGTGAQKAREVVETLRSISRRLGRTERK